MSCQLEVFTLGRREVTRSNTILEGPQALSQQKGLYVERQEPEFGFRTTRHCKAAPVSLQGEDLYYTSHGGTRHLYLCKGQLCYPEPLGPLGMLLS